MMIGWFAWFLRRCRGRYKNLMISSNQKMETLRIPDLKHWVYFECRDSRLSKNQFYLVSLARFQTIALFELNLHSRIGLKVHKWLVIGFNLIRNFNRTKIIKDTWRLDETSDGLHGASHPCKLTRGSPVICMGCIDGKDELKPNFITFLRAIMPRTWNQPKLQVTLYNDAEYEILRL